MSSIKLLPSPITSIFKESKPYFEEQCFFRSLLLIVWYTIWKKQRGTVDGTFTFHFQHLSLYSRFHTIRAIPHFGPIDVALSKIKITKHSRKEKASTNYNGNHTVLTFVHKAEIDLMLEPDGVSEFQTPTQGRHIVHFLPCGMEISTLILLFYFKLALMINLLFEASYSFLHNTKLFDTFLLEHWWDTDTLVSCTHPHWYFITKQDRRSMLVQQNCFHQILFFKR